MTNFESFNFSNLGGDNPFGEQKTTGTDDRFYRLAKDENGRGAAVIRFLPDSKMNLMQQLYRINVNNQRGGEKRWVSEWSPQNIGAPDPFHDHWAQLWRSGNKDEARKFARQTRYIANILVIKDPVNPENEGKVFLLDLSQTLKTIIQDALIPSKADQALGAEAKQLFNPIKGHNFKLNSKKAATGFISYESSGAEDAESSIFETPEEAMKFIKANCYDLDEFLDPKTYKSFEELKDMFDYVCFKESNSGTQSSKDSQEVEDPEMEIKSDTGLDDFLDKLDQ